MVIGAEKAAAQRPLGIDVSSYQDEPNWSDIKGAGITFAWAKATEGTFDDDGDYLYNVANAKSAGVYIGSYHFAHPEEDLGTSGADTEAGFFWDEAGPYIKNGGYYMMPMLDYETDPGSSYTATTSTEWVNEWCQDIVNDASSANSAVVKPVVYTYVSFADDYLTSAVTEWPLWMASPNGENPQTGAPSSTYPWSSWAVWQYGQGDVSGVSTGAVDEDVFNGTSSSLLNYVIGALAISINSPPGSLTVPPGTNVILTVIASATSGGTLHYQWQYDGTNIAGATTTQYAINNIQMTSAGAYGVVVTNTTGSNGATGYLSVKGPLTNAPGCAVGPAGMLNWWPADGNAIDILSGDNGVPQGSLGYAAGENGLAFNFNGSNSVIYTAATEIPGNWSACMWVYHEDSPQSVAGLLEDSTYALRLEQTNTIHKVGISVSGNNYYFEPLYGAPVGAWTHLAFVGTPTNTTLYVNGAFKSSLTNVMHLPRAYIGGGYNGTSYVDFMLGYLDDVITFDTALTAAQVAAIYNAGSASLVRAPQILGASQTGTNQVTINVEGQTGKIFTVYTSPDLINWTNIATLENTYGTNQFIDTNAINSQTFYQFSQTY